MSLDVQALKDAFVAVLTSNAAVVAALGSGVQSVIDARTLAVKTYPKAPFVAYRFGPITGAREDVRRLLATWWLYDDMGKLYRRLNPLATLIEVAYPEYDAIPGCSVKLVSIGDELIDQTIARPALSLRWHVNWRA